MTDEGHGQDGPTYLILPVDSPEETALVTAIVEDIDPNLLSEVELIGPEPIALQSDKNPGPVVAERHIYFDDVPDADF